MAQTIEIRVVASGAAEAAKVLQGVADAGANVGKVVASGAGDASKGISLLADTGGAALKSLVVSVEQAGVSMGGLGSVIGGLAGPLGIAAAAMTALSLGIKGVSDVMQEEFQLARQLGAVTDASATDTLNLVHAFQLLGFDSDKLQQGLFRLGAQMENNSNTLKQMGIDSTQPVLDAFMQLRDQMSKMDAQQRSAVGLDLMSRGYKELAAIFAMTSEEFATYLQKAKDLEGPTEAGIAATKQYVLAVKELKVTWEGLAVTLGVTLMPALAQVIKGVTGAVAALRDLANVPLVASHGASASWEAPAAAPSGSSDTAAAAVARAGGGFPSVSAAAAAFTTGAILPTKALAEALATLDAALGAVKTDFALGAVSSGTYRAALQTAANAMQGLAAQGVPQAQKQLETFRLEMGRLDQTQFKQSLEQRSAAIETAMQGELAAVKVAAAERTITAEDAVAKEHAIEVAGAAAQMQLYGQAVAARRGSAAEQLAVVKTYLSDVDKFNKAQGVQDIAAAQQVTKDLAAEFKVRTEDAKSAAATALGGVAEAEAAQLAAIKQAQDLGVLGILDAATQTRQTATKSADDRLQIEMGLIAKERALLADQLAARLITQDAYQTDSARLDADYQAVLVKHSRDTQVAEDRDRTAHVDVFKQAMAQTTSVQAASLTDQIQALEAQLAAGDLDVTKSEEARTEIVLKESQKRVLLYTTEEDKLREGFLAETDAYNKAQELRITADQRYLTSKLTLLQAANDAQQKSADLALAVDAELQRSAGNISGYYIDQFALAANAAGGYFGGLVTLAQESSRNMTTAVSDYFFDRWSGNLTTAAQLWTNFLNAMERALANFLASNLVQQFAALAVTALGGSGGGGIAAMLTALAGGGSAGGGQGGAGSTSTGTTSQTSSFASNYASLAQAGSGLAGMWSGVTSIGANWAAGSGLTGGLSNVLLGQAATYEAIGDQVLQVTQATNGLFGFGGAISGLSTALAGLGAAFEVFQGIMAAVNGNAAQAAATLGGVAVGAGAGAAIGSIVPGIGTIVGALFGAAAGGGIGSILGGLFGGGTQLTHDQREALELAKTQQAIAPLGTGLSTVTTAQQLMDLLTQYSSGYLGGTSSAAVMAQLNLPGGTAYVGQGAGVNNPDFPHPVVSDAAQLLALLTAHPEYLQMSIQAGVAQDKLVALNKALTDLVTSAVARINAIQTAQQQLDAAVTAQVQGLLPADVFDAFKTNTLDPLLAQMNAIIAAGGSLADMQTAFAALQAQIQAIDQVLAVIGQVNQEIAQFSGNLSAMASTAITSAQQQLTAADQAIQDARSHLIESISGPEIATAAQGLQAAILARYTLEKKLVDDLETAIGNLLSTYGTPLMNLQIALATAPGGGGITALLGSLQTLATSSVSATLRLWAVNAAIQAIGTTASTSGAGVSGPLSQAQPFFDQMASMIAQAISAGDLTSALSLLQQQVVAVQSLGQAAVTGVQAAAQVRTTALNAEKTALQAQLSVAQQWAQTVKSVGDYLTQLRLGTQAPPNPAGQFTLAQSTFSAAFAAFQANQTPEGAAAVQKSAGDLLAAAQLIYTRPSPEYAALFDDVTSKLQQVQTAAAALASPQDAMVASLAAIDAELAGVQADTTAQTQAIQTTLAPILADLAQQEGALLEQLLGVQEQTLVGITGGLSTSDFLAQKAAETVTALEDIKTLLYQFLTTPGAITAAAATTTTTAAAATTTPSTTTTAAATAEQGSPGNPYPVGSVENPIVTYQSGTASVPKTGLATLHQGEMVLPPAVADIVRKAQSGQGGDQSAGTVNVMITVNPSPGMDEAALAEHVAKVMHRELRFGKSGQIIKAFTQ